jgi:hypothetical protein
VEETNVMHDDVERNKSRNTHEYATFKTARVNYMIMLFFETTLQISITNSRLLDFRGKKKNW